MKFNIEPSNINYIKIICKDRNGSTCCLKAPVKNMNEKEIYAVLKTEQPINIKTPQDILLNIVCDDGLYRASTVLKYIRFEEDLINLTIQTPEETTFQQKREYFRVKLEERVILSYPFEGKMQRFPLKICNISASGICLELNEEIYIPDEVELDILFPQKSIKTKAKFVRIDKEEGILHASFNFLEISEHDVDIISQRCIQIQLEHKRSQLK